MTIDSESPGDAVAPDDPSSGGTLIDRRGLFLNAGKLAAAAAAAGPFFMASEQAAAAEYASTRAAAGDPIAKGAVDAAKKYKGEELTVLYEAQLQALDPKNFSGPLWEKLTGVKINVVEAPFPQGFTKAVSEHIAKSGAFDVIDSTPLGYLTSPTVGSSLRSTATSGSTKPSRRSRISTPSIEPLARARERPGDSSTMGTYSSSTTVKTSLQIQS